MKKKLIVYAFLLSAFAACGQDEKQADDSGPKGTVDFTTRASDDDGGAVLIFRKQANNYLYTEEFAPVWALKPSTTNEYVAKKTMLIGDYEFLFYKTSGLTRTTMTTLAAGTTQMDDIRFSVKPNTAKPGYSLPVDEIWLPETKALAHSTYTITGKNNPLVNAKLTRAVSGIEVILKRGKKEADGSYSELPFASGTDISSVIKSIALDISKLGSAIDLNGGTDNTAKTFVTLNTSAGTVDASTGFITLTGPLVFPNKTNETINVDLTLTPVSTTDYPNPLTATVSNGKAERNTKLCITVWFAATATPSTHSIAITVDYAPLGTPIDGDTGIWN